MSDSSDSDNPFKMEPLDDEEPEPEMSFGPAVLGLQRVGTAPPQRPQPKRPIQMLNARGMPARIRKRNRLFFDDEHVTTPAKPKTPKKSSTGKTPNRTTQQKAPAEPSPSSAKKRRLIPIKMATQKTKESDTKALAGRMGRKHNEGDTSQVSTNTGVSEEDRSVAQSISVRLRNLLKLPRAHRWVYFEFFYSSIDKCLFTGETDFQLCLREYFPKLGPRKMTRGEWSKIRRLMGKPRRCSKAFFDEERSVLHRKRNKIRLLQSRRTGDTSFVRDLPKRIPVALTIGTNVTARMGKPQDGIFPGVVIAVNSVDATYRISFDRDRGTYNVPDFEVATVDPSEMIHVSTLTHDFRPRPHGACYISSSLKRNRNSINRKDPLLGSESLNASRFRNVSLPRETIGGFSLKLLEKTIRLQKILTVKHTKIVLLRELLNDVEGLQAREIPLTDEFLRRIAALVVSLEKINANVFHIVNQVTMYSRDIVKEPSIMAMLEPSYLREKSRDMAIESVARNNNGSVTSQSMLNLITDLTMIMWVTAQISNGEENSHVMRVLDGCMEEVKNHINPVNIYSFQKNVQVHIRQIQEGLNRAKKT